MTSWAAESQACVHTHRLNPTDVNLLKAGEDQGLYPESSSFPWSLRSAAQSSDRQFFSNHVCEVKQSTGCLPHCQYNPRRDTSTRGCCCARLHTLNGTFFRQPSKLQYLSRGFKHNAQESAVCLRWTDLDIDTFALALQTNCTVTNSLRFHRNGFLMRWKMPAAWFLKLRGKSM